MPASNIVKVQQGSAVKILDGTSPSPLEFTGLYYDGDFQCDDLVYERESIPITVNGVFQGVAKGNYRPITGSFTVKYTGQASSTTNNPASVLDFIQSANAYATAVSTVAGYDQQLRTIVLTCEGTDFGDASDHTLTFLKCEVRAAFQAGEPSTWTIDFTCHGGTTRT